MNQLNFKKQDISYTPTPLYAYQAEARGKARGVYFEKIRIVKRGGTWNVLVKDIETMRFIKVLEGFKTLKSAIKEISFDVEQPA